MTIGLENGPLTEGFVGKGPQDTPGLDDEEHNVSEDGHNFRRSDIELLSD
jgi:hypothetical protein